MSLLENFFQYCDDHPAATDNLSLDSTMALWSRNDGVQVSEAIDFGYDILAVFAAGFAAFVAENGDITVPDLFVEFADNYLLSDGMRTQLANMLGEAADESEEDDPDEDEYEPADGEGIVQYETDAADDDEAHEQRMRNFLGKLLSNVPRSFEPYFGALKRFGKKDYLGNNWSGGARDCRDDPRNKRFGPATAARQERQSHRAFPSVYSSDAVTAALSEDVDMLLSPADNFDQSQYLDRSLSHHGKYGAGVSDNAHATNVKSLETKHWREGVMIPHSAVAEAEAYATLKGYEGGIRIQKVHHHHTHILVASKELAADLANHIGELYGRLVTQRFTLAEPEPDTSLYRKSELSQGLEKKPTVKQKRVVEQALSLMEKSNRPNTWNPVAQEMADKIAAERTKFKHPDDDAGERQTELR
jgi:hypothetical protein